MMINRNDYIGEIKFLISITTDTATKEKLFKILHNVQSKDIYTAELIELAKINKERELEQERMWNE